MDDENVPPKSSTMEGVHACSKFYFIAIAVYCVAWVDKEDEIGVMMGKGRHRQPR